jgi:hypothetical protein
MRTLTTLAVFTSLACGEVVDRVAASIGYQVITDSQVAQEIRIQSFIDGNPPDFRRDNKRSALDRLVDQFLIRRELTFTRFQPAGAAEADSLMAPVRARYPTEAAWKEALARYEITADDLKARLAWTLTMLRFIEYRFQPAVLITPAQIEQEYRRQAMSWRRTHGTEIPPLDQVRDDIEKIVRQQLVDSALDRWLAEVRTQNEILYHGDYKQ